MVNSEWLRSEDHITTRIEQMLIGSSASGHANTRLAKLVDGPQLCGDGWVAVAQGSKHSGKLLERILSENWELSADSAALLSHQLHQADLFLSSRIKNTFRNWLEEVFEPNQVARRMPRWKRSSSSPDSTAFLRTISEILEVFD